MTLLQAAHVSKTTSEASFEGEAPVVFHLPEGDARLIEDGSVAEKGFPCSKLQGIHRLILCLK